MVQNIFLYQKLYERIHIFFKKELSFTCFKETFPLFFPINESGVI